jgi:hypothetical protein
MIEEVIEVEVLEVEMEAEAVHLSEEVVVETEVLSQCTKLCVMNVTRVVRFLSVHQVINQYIVMIVLVKREAMKLLAAILTMIVLQEENSMIAQLLLSQSQQLLQ